MRIVFKILSVFLFLGLLFTRCKKYPDGGLHACAIRNLLTDDNDPWQLKLYSVKGIDSTYFIQTSSNPNFYQSTLAIFRKEKYSKDLLLYNNKYDYNAYLSEKKSALVCLIKTVGGGADQREILNPEGINSPAWTIQKLKKKKLILTATWNNSYTLIFEKE